MNTDLQNYLLAFAACTGGTNEELGDLYMHFGHYDFAETGEFAAYLLEGRLHPDALRHVDLCPGTYYSALAEVRPNPFNAHMAQMVLRLPAQEFWANEQAVMTSWLARHKGA